MTDTTTTPAEEAAPGAAPSAGSMFQRRHEGQSAHEPHREVGAAPEEEEQDNLPSLAPAAAPAATAQPGPTAAQPAPTPAPAAQSDEDALKGQPKWARDRIKAQNARIRELEAQTQSRPTGQPAPQPRPQQPRELPNPTEDPAGFVQAVREEAYRWAGQQAQAQFSEFEVRQNLRMSERDLVRQQGRETLEDVREWLRSKGQPLGDGRVLNPTEAWAMQQEDPWSAAHEQMQRELLAEEIGNDPEAYKKRLREEWEAEAAERQGAQPQAQPGMTAPTQQSRRPPPPAPASTVRSAQPRDDRGRFDGVRPMKFRNNF